MKQNIKSLVSGIIIGSMLTGGITLAKTGSETLEAWYSDIKIFVNGTKINPTDALGNAVEPFIVDGTTYLPVRAVGEALQKEVTWDGATASVYLTDKKTETIEPPAPTATPKPTPQPTEKPKETPTEFSYTTTEILQISGYREDAIKGEITTAWDEGQTNAAFYAKMRCNNGGLADYIDCEISLQEVISTKKDGFTGYFDVSMNDTLRHQKIKGTVTVDGSKLSLHTEEYDYKLVAKLAESESEANTKPVTYYSFNAIQYNGENASGLIGLEMNQTEPELNGSFTVGENKYTLQFHEVSSVSDKQIQGVFSVLCNGETIVNQVDETLSDLTAPLGDVMTLTIEGFSTLKLRVVEIGY
ncbi:MAG: hypothetical protein IJ367_00500 [Clostridia bacterium]|nr:hypothetical protein [Clostridia bacterium]